jgi:outer membrane protein assembly factor BamB
MPLPRWRRWLRLCATLIAVVAIALVVLAYGFGMRMEFDGSGSRPIISFESRNAHFAALERQRAAQRGRTPSSPPRADSGPGSGPAVPAPAGVTTPAAATTAPVPVAANLPTPTVAPPAVAAAAPPDSGWADFRGTRRDGVYTAQPTLRLPWGGEGPRPLWKQPIGEGYASFVAARGRAFTIEQRRSQEVVTAYDIDSGRELWAHGWNAQFSETMGGDGPRATPVWHQGRVYALGATGELRSLRDSDGGLLWRQDILRDNDAPNLPWGMSASPLVVDDKVIVLPGGPSGRSVVAYHKDTGARVWSVLDDPQAYTAPMVVTRLGVRQLLVVSARRMIGLSINDGGLLWEYPWVTDNGINASQPIPIGDNRLFISSGYGHGAALVELSRDGDRWHTRTIWQNTRMKNQFTSSVLRDGFVYGLDQSILACVDVATGELKWKGGRYGFGQLVLAGEHLIVLTERGELALVRATPESHQEVAITPAIDGKTWNHPALVDGRLLVRNAREMAAFDLRPQR